MSALLDPAHSAASRERSAGRPIALGLMLASGFAGLGYQIVWTQQCALWLGHEAAAVLAVVTAFFGGLALGALVLGARIERSPRPARWYAACEAVTGLWSLALALLMAPASGWLLDLTGAQPTPAWQWSVAFCGTFLLLLPATAAMGATLPTMERALAQLQQRAQTSLAALYGANTFGAVVGVLASAFWLVPSFGLMRTALLCVTLNGACAAAALWLFASTTAARSSSGRTDRSTAVPSRSALHVDRPASSTAEAGVLARLAATGLLGIGYEVLVVRVLAQVSENTVYTYAMLLAVYLVGSAMGAAGYQRWWVDEDPRTGTRIGTDNSPGRRPRDTVLDRLLLALAVACLLGTAALWQAAALKTGAAALPWQSLLGGVGAALAVEALPAGAAFLLPTVAMGALFSHLCTRGRDAGIGFGRSLGVNTLGAAFAAPLFGVALLPLLGAKFALLLVAAGYLLLSSRRAWFSPAVWAVSAVALALGVWAPPLTFVDMPEGGRIVSYREGALAAVSVVEDAGGVSRLRIDNRQQEGSSSSLLADARQALLPLLLHPAPQRALFLGLGTGMTAASAAEDPSVQVDVVELLPEVIGASAHFTKSFSDGTLHPPVPVRLHLMAADARRFVRASTQRYDVIVSDNFHPARSGSGSLYTVEHFQAVRARLTANGVFCQWLPLHQLDLQTLRSIVQAFVSVHPHAVAMLATNSLDTPVLGLVARADGARFDVRQVRDRLAHAALPRPLADFGITDDLSLLGSFVAGPKALARFAGNAPANTDDRPVVAYSAPRITYVPDSLPRDRLNALVQELGIAADELVDNGDPAWATRLDAYVSARNRYLDIGRSIMPSSDVRRMLAQVREPLLSVLRISPDFKPAYDPLLRMAMALGRSDPAGARTLLNELHRVQPARPEAAAALQALDGDLREGAASPR